MYPTHTHRQLVLTAVIASVLALAAGEAPAQNDLHLYGGPSTCPAIEEAALAFGDLYGVRVETAWGAAGDWLKRGRDNADLIFDEEEFVMSELARPALQAVQAQSVTPLYVRPAIVLVRPGNPKAIGDFPDLLAPGVSILVVHGGDRAGLWKEMIMKLRNARAVRALCSNLAIVATDQADALKIWNQRSDIDVWINWNIWHMPRRHQAQLITLSSEFEILRQCSIALTERGRQNPLADQFAKFLASPTGADIFESWSWQRALPGSTPLRLHNDVCLVCSLDSNQADHHLDKGLNSLKGLIENSRSVGVPREEMHIVALLSDDARTHLLLGDSADQPGESEIRALLAMGVNLEIGEPTPTTSASITEDILPGLRIVPDIHRRLLDLECVGYVPIRF